MARDNRTDFDRSKAGLQDDHDPSDPSRHAANKSHGVQYRDIQCDPSGASPKHNRILEQHGIPPEVVVDCHEEHPLARRV